MEVVHPRCCGLDVHKKSIVACRLTSREAGLPEKEIRSFATTTRAILELADWLAEGQVTHVALESTGVYWKPIYNLLEERFTLLLVNAAHIKHVPGRKTDKKDAEWIADLLRHGLLQASFVPPRPQRELRELTRYRTSLIQERSAEVNRLQKTLEGANIKLCSVVSDVMGLSARQILAALVAGQTDRVELAELAKGRLRDKLPQLQEALLGSFGAHQRFLVGQQLAHLEDLEKSLAAVSAEIERRLSTPPEPSCPPGEPEAGAAAEGAGQGKTASPDQEAVERLMTIPGVGRRTAQLLVAEVGTSMERFPTSGHLAAWAGMAPGNHESAGKRKSGKTRRGSRWLRAGLVEAAQAAGGTKGTYLGAQYKRLVGRLGKRRGAVAVGHTLLVIAYHLLQKGTVYEELGANYFDEQDRRGVKQRAVKRLEALGYQVTLTAQPAAA